MSYICCNERHEHAIASYETLRFEDYNKEPITCAIEACSLNQMLAQASAEGNYDVWLCFSDSHVIGSCTTQVERLEDDIKTAARTGFLTVFLKPTD